MILFKKLQNRYQLYILGDMNIDFLKYNYHTQTEEYLDMLHSNNISPIITKPTRITTGNYTATLIDHIYTNNTKQMISGIATIDISDHLPTFCIVDKNLRDIIETTGNLIQNYTYRMSKQLTGIVSTLKVMT